MWLKIILLLVISSLSGLLGRMGGAKGYDTKYRDIGCSLLAVATLCLFLGFSWAYWWVYLCIFGLHWGAFSTYWDVVFGYDNMWFSGFMVGVAMYPALFIDTGIWWILTIRAIALALAWGCFNKCLPKKILWFKDRAIVEEYLRYMVSQ
jgi:hypothetical protein